MPMILHYTVFNGVTITDIRVNYGGSWDRYWGKVSVLFSKGLVSLIGYKLVN